MEPVTCRWVQAELTAALAGCATATIRRLLQIDGVPQRPAYRRPPPESGITREWLHREYVVKLRSINTIARRAAG